MQISTATGRLSFTDPPIQTVPRDNDYRNMVIPRPGYKLVSADLSQAELRIVAMLANDEEMIKAFASGFDLHAYTASLMLLKIDPKDFNKKIPAHAKARTIAKSINFGIVYGTSAFALADQVNEALFRSYKEALDAGDTEAKFEELSVEEAQDNIDAWLNLYHGVRDWIINIKNFAATHGYVETIFGRRRYLPYVHSSNQGIREAELRKAVNTPVQSTANEIALLGLNKMTRFVKDYKMLSRPIMIIHDEIILECPDAEVDTIGEKLTESLTQNIPFVTIPLIADFGVMDKWQKD
jgi:DNA polymerase-1